MVKMTLSRLWKMKEKGEKITMTTASDYPTALMVDKAGLDMILVGDSLGMLCAQTLRIHYNYLEKDILLI